MRNWTENEKYKIVESLQGYVVLLNIFFFSIPFLVLIWYGFSQFLAGAPEPEWWINLEIMVETWLSG